MLFFKFDLYYRLGCIIISTIFFASLGPLIFASILPNVHVSQFDFARADARVFFFFFFFFGCLHTKEFESSATSRKFRPGLASVVVSTDAARSRRAAAQLN